MSVFVIPVVICKKKGRRKGHAGKQNRTRRTRSVRLVVWGSVCVCVACVMGWGVRVQLCSFSTTGADWLWMLELAEEREDAWCAGEEREREQMPP